MNTSREHYRAARRQQWDEAGKGYSELANRALAELMHQASAEILRHLSLSPNARILDVGTGPGNPAIEIASRVGEEGWVVGIDFAPSMIEVAWRRARLAGLNRVEFIEADAESLPFPDESFDAVVSRYGLPHFTDAVQALKEARRVLRPGGRFVAAMHGAIERNPYFTAPVLALKRYQANPAPITDRGPFYFHAPHLLETAMRSAGFEAPRVYAHDTSFAIEDFESYWQAQKSGGAAIRRELSLVPFERRHEAEQAARAALAGYVSNNRAVFPAQIMVGIGLKNPGRTHD